MNAIVLCAFDHGTSAKAKTVSKEREERISHFAPFVSLADELPFGHPAKTLDGARQRTHGVGP
ncbi:MAG TPA: hypothetical protein VKV22_13640 [Rhodanobacteraceae bacterium]|nr:hypothetical protein [Rhodanobacteraceae bacterium]